jgi:serine/threonine-protein kinase RsbW
MASPDDGPEIMLDLHVEATEEGMSVVHQALDELWPRLHQERGLESAWCVAFTVAVAEVAANIIQHAHPSDSHLVPFSLSLSARPDRLVGKFTDRGIPARPPKSPEMPSVNVSYAELGERGRGLALVQATTDRFEYRRTAAGENIWTIEKYFPL